MRNDGHHGGRCAVIDDSPRLVGFNQTIVDVYISARDSADQINTEDKVHKIIRPTEIEAIIRMMNVPLEYAARILSGVKILQDLANRMRPRKAPKQRSRRGVR